MDGFTWSVLECYVPDNFFLILVVKINNGHTIPLKYCPKLADQKFIPVCEPNGILGRDGKKRLNDIDRKYVKMNNGHTIPLKYWQKLADGKFIPVCEPNDILGRHGKKRLNGIDRKYVNLVLCDMPQDEGGTDLKPFWRCFEKKYECYVKKKKIITLEDDFYDFVTLQLSFKHLGEDENVNKKIFRFKTKDEIDNLKEGYQYVSDKFGLAFLYYLKKKIKCYYFHFETKSTTHIQVPYTQNTLGEISVKLYNGTIWIIACSSNVYNIDVIYIKKHQTWHHLRWKLETTGETKFLMSKNILVPSNIRFSKCKILYINEKAEIRETNFNKPDQLTEKGLYIIGVIDEMFVIGKLNSGIFYFVAYRKLEFLFLKKLDMNQLLENYETVSWSLTSVILYPQAKKMVLKTPNASLIVICLIKCEIIQIMEYIDCFWTHKISIHISRNCDELRFISKKQNPPYRRDEKEYLCLKLNLYRGMLLKELAINAILNHFSLEVIRKFTLPKTLLTEIIKAGGEVSEVRHKEAVVRN